MNYIYLLKKNSLKVNSLIILISFFLFFWDVKIYYNFGLREIIGISILFILNDIIKNKFFFGKNKKNLIFIFSTCLFIFIHQISNTFFDNSEYTSHNWLGILALFFLFFFIFSYYELILSKLGLIINFFCLILITSYFFSDIVTSSVWEIENLCSNYFKFENKLIFAENSHLGMMIGPVLGYYLYKIKSKNILFLFAFYSIIFFLLLFEPSTTLVISILVSLFLVTIYDLKFFFKKNIYFIIIFLSIVYLNVSNKNCFFKISDTLKGINSVVMSEKILKLKNNENLKNSKIKSKKLESLNSRKRKDIDIKVIRKLPVKNYNSIISFNLSSAVLLNSLNIALETNLTRPLGWGFNRYENAFDHYMFNGIVIPYVYREVYTLNYNDGASNFSKLFTEFGLLALILIPFIFYFFFTKQISNEKKIFFLAIILTQLIRGAGYFNGGFLFSIIIVILTILNIKNNEAKN